MMNELDLRLYNHNSGVDEDELNNGDNFSIPKKNNIGKETNVSIINDSLFKKHISIENDIRRFKKSKQKSKATIKQQSSQRRAAIFAPLQSGSACRSRVCFVIYFF